MKLSIKNKLIAMVLSLLGASILILGLIAINMGSSALTTQTNTDAVQYATEGANHIGSIIQGNLALLAEATEKNGVNTMDFNTQVQALSENVNKLGYQDIAVMNLSGHAKYIIGGGEFDSAKQFWYENGFKGETAISDVAISKVTKLPVVFDVAPIKLNGQVVGLLVGRRDPTFLKTVTNTLGDGVKKYGFVLNESGGFMAHPDDQIILDQINVFNDIEANGPWKSLGQAFKNKGEATTGQITYTAENKEKMGAYAPIPGTSWTLVVAQYESDVTAPMTHLRNIILIGAIILLLIAGVIAYQLSKRMTKPITELKDIANQLAVGDVDVTIQSKSTDEIGDLMASFGHMIENTKRQANAAQKLAEGDFSVAITPQSEKDVLSYSLIAVIAEMNKVHDGIEQIGQAAQQGQLNHRGNTNDYAGGYKDLIVSLNNVINTFVKPLKVASKAIERIGNGVIPPPITTEYQGDFNDLKNNINACIEGLGALVEGNHVLSMMSVNDLSEKIEGNYLGIYQEISKSINNVHDKLAHIVSISTNIANGNLCDLEYLQTSGKQSENDTFIPALIAMIENIENLVAETHQLAQTAIQGDLNNRGDAARFSGEYAKVIEGFNQTLDAVIAPITEASTVLKELSNGNLHVAMTGDFKGQHGQIKEDMNHTIDFLRHYVDEISDTLSQIGAGDMRLEITADYVGDFRKIRDSINGITTQLSEVMSEISNSADQVELGARQISEGGQVLAQGTTEQASTIQQLTASIEEVAGETQQNARNANDARTRVVEVRNNAEDGNAQMQHLVTAMDEIRESSNNISKIIKVIDDIAFQTNILALNASVESARAGQHGRGFAVVAEEVRTLAARSAEAVRETAKLIDESIEKVAVGTSIVGETSESLNGMMKDIEEVARLVNNIANASADQASEIAQITQGIEQVSVVVQSNSATAEESAASSEELTGQAEMMKSMVNAFKLKH